MIEEILSNLDYWSDTTKIDIVDVDVSDLEALQGLNVEDDFDVTDVDEGVDEESPTQSPLHSLQVSISLTGPGPGSTLSVFAEKLESSRANQNQVSRIGEPFIEVSR